MMPNSVTDDPFKLFNLYWQQNNQEAAQPGKPAKVTPTNNTTLTPEEKPAPNKDPASPGKGYPVSSKTTAPKHIIGPSKKDASVTNNTSISTPTAHVHATSSTHGTTPPPSPSTNSNKSDGSHGAGIGWAAISGQSLGIDDQENVLLHHIQAMGLLSSDIKKRYTPTTDLHRKKPSSEQYQYAKALTPGERTLLSAALEEYIIGGPNAPAIAISKDSALEMWLSVQYARLRTHTDKQKRRHVAGQIAGDVATLGLAPRLWKAHKNYYRDAHRPEYGAAFKQIMGMLRDERVSEEHKMVIAENLLDRYIREEGIIAVRDQNAIIGSLPVGKRSKATGRQTVAKAPDKTNDDRDLYRAIIKFAKGEERELASQEQVLAQLARDVGWTETGLLDIGGRWDHFQQKRKGTRTDKEKMEAFVAYVRQNKPTGGDDEINEDLLEGDKAGSRLDPYDPTRTLRQYEARINNQRVILTLDLDEQDKVANVYTFQHELAKWPELKKTLDKLNSNAEWDVKYGAATKYDAQNKQVTINPQDGETAVLTLARDIFKSDDKNTAELKKLVDRIHEYLLENAPQGGYKVRFRENGLGDWRAGLYNATLRWMEEDIMQCGELHDPPNPGLTRNDSIRIALFDFLWSDLNMVIWSGDEEAKEKVKPLYDQCIQTLAKRSSHAGTFRRKTLGGSVRSYGIVPSETIDAYRKGKTINEAAFIIVHNDEVLRPELANLGYKVKATDAKPLTPFSKKMALLPGQYQVLERYVYHKGNDKRPKEAHIKLQQVADLKGKGKSVDEVDPVEVEDNNDESDLENLIQL